jgi:cytidylate kinase
MSQPADLTEMEADIGEGAPPRHGYRGDPGGTPRLAAPRGLSIAVSREAGARGGTIARLVGQNLGWQVYDQELLEYLAQDGPARQALADELPPACVEWVEARLAELGPVDDERTASLVRLMLELGASGEVVLIGRGAGCVLPRRTTLNVRIVAPLPDRIAYLGQWLRLSGDEAAEAVRARDGRRSDFVQAVFGRSPTEPHLYDILLNSGTLGEGACADLIARAARARWEHLAAGLA